MNTNSLTAFAEVPNFEEKHHGIILIALKRAKNEMTYKEIAKSIRIDFYNKKQNRLALEWTDPNKVSRRMKKLVFLGKVKKCESRICTVANTMCSTYQITA